MKKIIMACIILTVFTGCVRRFYFYTRYDNNQNPFEIVDTPFNLSCTVLNTGMGKDARTSVSVDIAYKDTVDLFYKGFAKKKLLIDSVRALVIVPQTKDTLKLDTNETEIGYYHIGKDRDLHYDYYTQDKMSKFLNLQINYAIDSAGTIIRRQVYYKNLKLDHVTNWFSTGPCM
jgi:hypothetical protein